MTKSKPSPEHKPQGIVSFKVSTEFASQILLEIQNRISLDLHLRATEVYNKFPHVFHKGLIKTHLSAIYQVLDTKVSLCAAIETSEQIYNLQW